MVKGLDEAEIQIYYEIVDFITKNQRNPSKYDDMERGMYVNCLMQYGELYNSGEMKAERVDKFKELLIVTRTYRRIHMYE